MDPTERSLIAAIQAKPDDNKVRLVYADWLEERGDSRAEFLRLCCQLAALKADDPARSELIDLTNQLRADIDIAWLQSLGYPPRYTLAIDWDRKLINRYEPATDALLDSIEASMGHKLPAEYRQFLKQYHGGTFKESAYLPAAEGVEDAEDASFLFVCAYEDEVDQYHDADWSDADDPEQAIRVMWGGSYYMWLVVAGKDYGKVLIEKAYSHVWLDSSSLSDTLARLESSRWETSDPSALRPFRAVLWGEDDWIRDYLDQGGDPNLINEEGASLLVEAASNQPHIVKALLEAGADTERTSAHGNTALTVAALNCYDSVRALLAHGADANYVIPGGLPPIIGARSIRSGIALLKAGADMHARDKEGNTLLANEKGKSPKFCQILAEAGYDFSYDVEVLRGSLREEMSKSELNSTRIYETLRSVWAMGIHAAAALPELKALKPVFASKMRIDLEFLEECLNRVQGTSSTHGD